MLRSTTRTTTRATAHATSHPAARGPRPVRTAAVCAALAGLGGAALAAPALAGTVSRADGELTRYAGKAPVASAPPGASARVQAVETGDGRTVVTLHVAGLEPGQAYGAHAHVAPCGPTGAAAGPHWQHVGDPVSPSVDPAYANPDNEIWLDLTTNAAGQGHARAVLEWTFPSVGRPRSVILHEKHTATGPGEAGTAGQRVACLTVPF